MLLDNIHRDFILMPITSVLEDAIESSRGLTGGIEFYPLKDYLFQSMFLRMTGFQEQKLKCLCWVMATYDFDYRRTLINNEDGLGECSTIEAKTKIYKRIIDSIQRFNDNKKLIDIVTIDTKNKIKDGCVKEINELFKDTIFETWAPTALWDLNKNNGLFDTGQFMVNETTLVETKLADAYKVLYDNRNRFAHNTLSYQENIPSLKSLATTPAYNQNFFLWFAILNLFDKVFMYLYLELEKAIDYKAA